MWSGWADGLAGRVGRAAPALGSAPAPCAAAGWCNVAPQQNSATSVPATRFCPCACCRPMVLTAHAQAGLAQCWRGTAASLAAAPARPLPVPQPKTDHLIAHVAPAAQAAALHSALQRAGGRRLLALDAGAGVHQLGAMTGLLAPQQVVCAMPHALWLAAVLPCAGQAPLPATLLAKGVLLAALLAAPARQAALPALVLAVDKGLTAPAGSALFSPDIRALCWTRPASSGGSAGVLCCAVPQRRGGRPGAAAGHSARALSRSGCPAPPATRPAHSTGWPGSPAW